MISSMVDDAVTPASSAAGCTTHAVAEGGLGHELHVVGRHVVAAGRHRHRPGGAQHGQRGPRRRPHGEVGVGARLTDEVEDVAAHLGGHVGTRQRRGGEGAQEPGTAHAGQGVGAEGGSASRPAARPRRHGRGSRG